MLRSSGIEAWTLIVLLGYGLVGRSAPARDLEYLAELRRMGFGPLAIEYANSRLERADLAPEVRAEFELERAGALVGQAQSDGELSARQAWLTQAHSAYETFIKQFPDHPRFAEALLGKATIDLQQGRFLLVEAEQAGPSKQADDKRKEARQRFEIARDGYSNARQRVSAELAQLTGFVDPDKDREVFQRRDRLFASEVEADFQSALAQFMIADSYRSDDHEADARLLEQASYRKPLESALTTFTKLHDDHRRELIGLYAQLWSARTMAALGDHRRADFVFQSLLEHDNRALDPLKREAFYFRLISLASQRSDSVIAKIGPDWLKANRPFRDEAAYGGVQLITARAMIRQADSMPESPEQRILYRDADELLSDLVRGGGIQASAAGREKLKIARLMNREMKGTTFEELSSLAQSLLDEALRPEQPASVRSAKLDEVIKTFEKALSVANSKDDPEAVATTRMSLAFTHWQKGEPARAAEIALTVAEQDPPVARSGEAALLAMEAIASQWGGGLPQNSSDLERVQAIGKKLLERFPKSASADKARLLLGRIHFTLEDYPAAVALFDAVPSTSKSFGSARSLSGLAHKQQARDTELAAEELDRLRRDGVDRLREASKQFHESKLTPADEELFRNDAALAELLIDLNQPAEAVPVLEPLIAQLADAKDQNLRAATLLAAVEAYLGTGDLPKTQALLDRLSSEGSGDLSSGVTGVLVGLAQSLRQRVDEQSAAGKKMSSQQIEAYASFLGQVAKREDGQTPVTRTILADALLSIGRHQQALELLEKARTDPNADEPVRVRSALLAARAASLLGRHDEAKNRITELLKANPKTRDVIWERGEILRQAGDVPGEITHWQWYLDRLRRVNPRPEDVYRVTDRLCGLYLDWGEKVRGAERQKVLTQGLRFAAYLLETDSRMPASWRKKIDSRATEIRSELAGASGRSPSAAR